MSAPGIITNETVNIIEAIAPVDINAAGATGNMISMKNAAHCTIIIKSGTWAAGTSAITVEQAVDVTDSTTTSKAVAFTSMWTNDGVPTTSVLTKTTVTANTFNVDVALSMYVIEISADMLDVDNGYDCLQVLSATPGANACLLDATYILSGTRYSGDNAALSN